MIKTDRELPAASKLGGSGSNDHNELIHLVVMVEPAKVFID